MTGLLVGPPVGDDHPNTLGWFLRNREYGKHVCFFEPNIERKLDSRLSLRDLLMTFHDIAM
jgi:hypothetical protein